MDFVNGMLADVDFADIGYITKSSRLILVLHILFFDTVF